MLERGIHGVQSDQDGRRSALAEHGTQAMSQRRRSHRSRSADLDFFFLFSIFVANFRAAHRRITQRAVFPFV